MRSWGGGFLALAISTAVVFGSISFLYLSGVGMLLDEVSWVVWAMWLGISTVASFVFVWPIIVWQRRQYRSHIQQVHLALYSLQIALYRYTNAHYCAMVREALILVLSTHSDYCPCCGAELPPGGEGDSANHGTIWYRGNEIPCPVPRAKMLIG